MLLMHETNTMAETFHTCDTIMDLFKWDIMYMMEHTQVWDLINFGLHYIIHSARELEVNEKYT